MTTVMTQTAASKTQYEWIPRRRSHLKAIIFFYEYKGKIGNNNDKTFEIEGTVQIKIKRTRA